MNAPKVEHITARVGPLEQAAIAYLRRECPGFSLSAMIRETLLDEALARGFERRAKER